MQLKTRLKRALPYRARQMIKRALRLGGDTPNANAKGYYDPGDFPFLQVLESEWRSIRRELDALDASHFIDWPSDDHIGSWTAFGLYAMQRKLGENCQLCPETTHLVEQVPGLVTAGFSALAPGTRILPHRDLSNVTLRCHLGLVVPEGCRMRVGAETRSWAEGRWLVFDGAVEHEVWHDGTARRIVLLLDFLKPGMAYDHGFNRAAQKMMPGTAEIPAHGT